MGYDIEQDMEQSEFFLPADKVEAAFRALKNELDDRKDKNNWHFIDWGDLAEAENLEEALEACRWQIETDEAGNVTSIEFIGQRMGWKEKDVFRLLAREGAVGKVHMRGEDANEWDYVMNNGIMVIPD